MGVLVVVQVVNLQAAARLQGVIQTMVLVDKLVIQVMAPVVAVVVQPQSVQVEQRLVLPVSVVMVGKV
jgi:hypothetical protein